MSYKFNGSNRIEFNDSDYNITGNLTLALWVKWSVLSTRTLIDYGQGKNSVSSADNNTPYLLELSSGDKLRLAWQVGTGFSDDALSTTFSPAINVWTHIACTRNSGTDEVIFYVNGAQLGTPVSYGSEADGGGSAANRLNVGGHSNYTPHQGWLAGIGIWASVRPASEIADLALGRSPGHFDGGALGSLRANIPLLKTPHLDLAVAA